MAGVTLKKSDRAINWIEKHLYIPDGKFVGKPFRLVEFQKKILRDIYDNPKAVTRTAIISMPRKSAKTTLTACIMLLHLVGPFSMANSSIIGSARSREQASIMYDLAQKMVVQSPSLINFVRFNNTKRQISCPKLGTKFTAIAADAKNTVGISPVLHLCDELGQVAASSDRLYSAVETGMSAHAAPMTIILSTQAMDDNSLLSLLIDSALRESKPEAVVTLFAAPQDADIFDPAVLSAANPAWESFANQTELLHQQKEARSLPSIENQFRNYTLNQRVAATTPFIAKTIWQANGDRVDDWKGRKLYLGLDLSQTSDLSALVAVYHSEDDDEKLNVYPWIWLPEEGLFERSQKEQIEWWQWAKNGMLLTTPGIDIDYAFLAKQLYQIHQEAKIQMVAFDKAYFRHLKKELLIAGFGEKEIGKLFVEYNQGFTTMSHAIRVLESMLKNEKLKHNNHPILTMCMANAKVIHDSTGNRKLEKAGKTKKIDAAISLLMAAAMYHEYRDKCEANKMPYWWEV